jgi:hypothetical protein
MVPRNHVTGEWCSGTTSLGNGAPEPHLWGMVSRNHIIGEWCPGTSSLGNGIPEPQHWGMVSRNHITGEWCSRFGPPITIRKELLAREIRKTAYKSVGKCWTILADRSKPTEEELLQTANMKSKPKLTRVTLFHEEKKATTNTPQQNVLLYCWTGDMRIESTPMCITNRHARQSIRAGIHQQLHRSNAPIHVD